MRHICIGNLTIIGWDNGLSPVRHQAIIWTNALSLPIGPLGTNFSQIVFEIQTFSFKKMLLKISSAKWWSLCLCLNVIMDWPKSCKDLQSINTCSVFKTNYTAYHYPMKYVPRLVLCYFCVFKVSLSEEYSHILQGYFIGTGAIIWFTQYKWDNPVGYISKLNGSKSMKKQ